ncbi:sensor histidine kinase [Paenibacillus methanolicus]|uniref:Two-component system sensor histidine kinase YesM n=1 Tax=Paenibacillus methanolicus TaxID=582686 RepID=A0A5S5BSJ5_9BACL|nr:histidine kinase [Paenibacillus methanolicus]TYP69162.1 two-component system sensor histidine kinase YesM [Paenibacillus methanolicus]
MSRFSIFTKLLATLLILLFPILLLFSMSNRTSTEVLTDEIIKVKRYQMETFADQLDQLFFRLDTYKKMLYESTDVRNLAYPDLLDDVLDKYRINRTVSEEINRLAGYGDWKAVIAVLYPRTGIVIKSNSNLNALPDELPARDTFWQYYSDPAEDYFMGILSYPENSAESGEAHMRVVLKFGVAALRSALSEFKANGSGDPFLYLPGADPIYNYSVHVDQTNEFLPRLQAIDPARESGYMMLESGQTRFQVHYQKLESLGWYLVDYVPISQIMAPISRNQTMFYVIGGMLLFMGAYLAFVMYRNIQIPFRKLIQNMNLIEKGIYSIRMTDKPKGEYRFLYERFNAMASKIEELIEDVYKEQLRSKDATLKQLQSQINPHFLYNTLAYIKSMIELKENKAAISMTMNLSKYYRYTTKTGSKMARLQEELDLIHFYLDIHCMLRDDFEFTIEIEPQMEDLEVPRLIVQPLVENVILHSFDQQSDYGMIAIRCWRTGDMNHVAVEDTGGGIDYAAIEAIGKKIYSNNEEIESGLKNVHQRLRLLYGGESGLKLSKSKLGGLCVELCWSGRESGS